jgi:small redox-active disulfide protein 2
MKKIEILGMGCPKCNRLTTLTEETAKSLRIEYTIEKVTDIKQIMEYGVMTTPALVIDGQLKTVGKVPTIEELKKILS